MALSLDEFLVALIASVSLYYYENIDPNLKPIDVTPDNMLPSYDFIIIGGGTAGSVVASRLSEIPIWNVLLLEAGDQEDAVTDAPVVFPLGYFRNSKYDWNFTTIEQSKACRSDEGVCAYPQGHVLGGSSSINGMIYVRGNSEDFDGWAMDGCNGWSYEEILPFFTKMENSSKRVLDAGFGNFRGSSGPLNVKYLFESFSTPLRKDYMRALSEYDIPQGDINGLCQKAADFVQVTELGPSRHSFAKAYLGPSRNRTNLNVALNTHVTKIFIDPETMTATGVEFVKHGVTSTVVANREVILSAGSIQTPKILMLSGIGPKKLLDCLDLDVIADLPVGSNLHDHLSYTLTFQLLNITPFDSVLSQEAIDKYTNLTGPISFTGAEVVAFENVFDRTKPSNVEYLLGGFNVFEGGYEIKITSIVLQPASRGSVRLDSNDIRNDPLIDPNFNDEILDVMTGVEAIKNIFDIMDTPSMKTFSPILKTSLIPFCIDTVDDRQKLAECIVRIYSSPMYHPVGTAKMGSRCDQRAVVDTNLLVKGIQNLRVIDASVMPVITRGDTNAPVGAIAEKGADLIKSWYGFS